MPIPPAAETHYRDQQRQSVAAMALSRRLWSMLNGGGAWSEVWPKLMVVVSSAQLGAAKAGASYVPLVLDQLGIDSSAEGSVNPAIFSGVASDGRRLASLLESPMIQAGAMIALGMSPTLAMNRGGLALDRIVQTQVTDAGRAAASVAIAIRPGASGYVRMLNTPCCSRCALLGGRFYRWNAGFRRHPRCDCIHIPASESVAGDLRTDPLGSIRAGLVTGISKPDLKAILVDGADLNKVLNARRGMSVEQVFNQRLKVTTEGTSRKAGNKVVRINSGGTLINIRLRPDAIYRIATSRAQAIDLLRLYGYIT